MKMLRVTDIASSLELTTGRIYQLINEGVIPAVKIGRTVRIPQDDWEKWFLEHVESSQQNAPEKKH